MFCGRMLHAVLLFQACINGMVRSQEHDCAHAMCLFTCKSPCCPAQAGPFSCCLYALP